MKKINVYGTGQNALRFVLMHRDIEINAFIEGNKAFNTVVDITKLNRGDIPIVMIEDAIGGVLSQYYTVVATSENAYWEIKNKLENAGLIEFENFEYYETYKKKIAIIYGNCHTAPIKQALKKSKSFSDEYGFYPIRQIQQIHLSESEDLECAAFEKCDLFIHQCIWEKNGYGTQYASENIIRRMKKECRIIGIPNVYRMPQFLFPQMNYENEIKYNGYDGLGHRDIYLDRYYKEMSVSELCNMIRDDSLISAADILQQRDEFFEKLVKREKEWDIKVSRFISENISKKQLFYDPGHPTEILMEYIIRALFEILQLQFEPSIVIGTTILDTYEMPIYASVFKAMKLNYKQSFIRNHSPIKLTDVSMDIEEYVRQYIAWFGN
jgi:hypothetical protein